MKNKEEERNRYKLQKIARKAMLEKGLLPDFPDSVIDEVNRLTESSIDKGIIDQRNLLWCSIDNDDSRDLDQLTVAIKVSEDKVKILVAIADVDALVNKLSEIDKHAMKNTTSVYTVAQIFPMLPEKLSTDLTSLNYDTDRLAIVVEMLIEENGNISESDVYRAMVRNKAKLTYKHIADLLEEKEKAQEEISKVAGLEENIRIQYSIAKKLKALRNAHGALNLNLIKTSPIFEGDSIKKLELEKRSSSKDMIEDFMIAANGVTAKFLERSGFPSIRRIVRTPKRWDRIIEIAANLNYTLPTIPDSKALDGFLVSTKKTNPMNYQDLSLSVLKLLGPGEYVVEVPGQTTIGHFGLAVKDYAHSTAPNRRYPDLLTQRLLKSAIYGDTTPYSSEELSVLAKHCTDVEDSAKKIERQVRKSAEAMLFESRIGDVFEAIITGTSNKGTWIRIIEPPIEGKLVGGHSNIDVGDKIKVKLVYIDVERGFIDFKQY